MRKYIYLIILLLVICFCGTENPLSTARLNAPMGLVAKPATKAVKLYFFALQPEEQEEEVVDFDAEQAESDAESARMKGMAGGGGPGGAGKKGFKIFADLLLEHRLGQENHYVSCFIDCDICCKLICLRELFT